MRLWFQIGCGLLCLAVILGAFGAHGLRGKLDPYMLSVYEKGVFYHFIHALGILIVALAAHTNLLTSGWTSKSLWCFLVGILLFSGSLYTLAVTGITTLGMITPIGGVLFIVGWLLLVFP